MKAIAQYGDKIQVSQKQIWSLIKILELNLMAIAIPADTSLKPYNSHQKYTNKFAYLLNMAKVIKNFAPPSQDLTETVPKPQVPKAEDH